MHSVGLKCLSCLPQACEQRHQQAIINLSLTFRAATTRLTDQTYGNSTRDAKEREGRARDHATEERPGEQNSRHQEPPGPVAARQG